MGKGFDAKPTPGRHGYDAKPTPGRAENNGQQNHARSGLGIGQHRSSGNSGAPGEQTGQRSRLEPGAHVGQERGGDQQMSVGASRIDADISTTSHSAGPLSPGEKGGADDER